MHKRLFWNRMYKSVAIRDGKITDVYPFVEVAWIDSGQEAQDTVAKIITYNNSKFI